MPQLSYYPFKNVYIYIYIYKCVCVCVRVCVCFQKPTVEKLKSLFFAIKLKTGSFVK